MEDYQPPSLTLMQQPATYETIDKLFAHGFINQQAREYAYEFLDPHKNWGFWMGQILTALGCGLILSGIALFTTEKLIKPVNIYWLIILTVIFGVGLFLIIFLKTAYAIKNNQGR